MKIHAVLGRASKNDFWDICELLQHYSLEQMIDFYVAKYPNQMLLISIPQTQCYSDEAEGSEEPVSLEGQTWETVKQGITSAVRAYLS